MGRSRGNFHAEDDPTQRTRRKKNVSSGENSESASTGQGTTDGKKALYHCNYCNKDITGRIRVKCAVCSDFDLCVECFSVGAEVHPHESSHAYRVMDVLPFPLITPEWTVDEEMLLLEGLEMYGMGNWAEVAEHVATKSKKVCTEHYRNMYLNSPYFPLPDMTLVDGKSRNELLAMPKGNLEEKIGELQLNEETLFSPSPLKVEDLYKGGSSGRSPSASSAEKETTGDKVNKKASNVSNAKDQGDHTKMEGRSVGGNKPTSAKDKASYFKEESGYNPKRQEFEIEYDNDAEQLLVDLEFEETDTEYVRELKMRVLHIFSKRLAERYRRKDFILERNLLVPNPFGELSEEEKDICHKYDRFMRLHSKEAHEALIKSVIEAHRSEKRLVEVEEAKAAGCRSMADVERYIEQRNREAEERKEANKFGTCSTAATSTGRANSSTDPGSASASAANLLSESEKQLCREIGLPPKLYLRLEEQMTTLILRGRIRTVSDAYAIYQFDPVKIEKVYNMLVKKGIAQP